MYRYSRSYTDVPFPYHNQQPLGIRKPSFTLRPRSSRQSFPEGLSVSFQRHESWFNEHVLRWSEEQTERCSIKCCSQGEARKDSVAEVYNEVNEMEILEKETYSVDDALEGLGFGRYQSFLLVYAGMAWVAEAMEMMLLSFVGRSVKDLWHLSPTEESFITSAVFGGMMIGAYSWGFLSDAKGRRVGFFATSVLTLIAGFLSAFSPNYLTLLLLRGLVGVGLGGGPVVSTWFMEFVPSANRGQWMIIMSMFWTLGSVAEALLAWTVMPDLGWRWLLGFSCVPLAVLLLFYPWVPESPRYLASKGDVKRATDILQSMAELNRKPLPRGSLASSVAEVVDHKDSKEVAFEKKHSASEGVHLLKDSSREALSTDMARKPLSTSTDFEIFSKFARLLSPGIRRSTLLLWAIFFSNAFTYYGIVLLSTQLSGGGVNCDVDSSIQPPPDVNGGSLYRDVFITSFAELPGLAIAAGTVDIFGRKRTMAGLFSLCGIFMLPLMQHQGEIVTTGLLFGARASIMGAFTVLFIYAPEVYPTGLRSTGLGIANSFGRIGGLVCPLVAVDLVQNCHQQWAAALFAVLPVSAGILALQLPTETKGRALPDT